MDLTRRQVIASLAPLLGGLAFPGLAAAGVPRETEERAAVLLALSQTVSPLPSPAHEDAVALLQDDLTPVGRHVDLLVGHLQRIARREGLSGFADADPPGRRRVLCAATAGSGPLARLCRGAVFVAQVAFYAGVFHPERGNPAIGFEGAYRFDGFASVTYPESSAYRSRAATSDGNPA